MVKMGVWEMSKINPEELKKNDDRTKIWWVYWMHPSHHAPGRTSFPFPKLFIGSQPFLKEK